MFMSFFYAFYQLLDSLGLVAHRPEVGDYLKFRHRSVSPAYLTSEMGGSVWPPTTILSIITPSIIAHLCVNSQESAPIFASWTLKLDQPALNTQTRSRCACSHA